jgi:hypothetical protein
VTDDYLDYPPEWYTGTIQARIRARANYTCEICGMPFDPLTNTAVDTRTGDGQPIFGHVHHLDHCPPNCDDANLIYLCQICHIRLHGLGWKPGDELPISWDNEPPHWILKRGLPYQLNPAVRSLHESARYLTDRQERARFLIRLIEQEGWIRGDYDGLSEMRGFLNVVMAEYESLLAERTQAAQIPILAQAAQWAAERGFVPYDEAVARSGLPAFDFDAAVAEGLIEWESCPFDDPAIPAYFDAGKIGLSEESKHQLWSGMRLTREQAAGVLGLSIPIFERLRRQAAIKPLPTLRTAGERPEPIYRRMDVEKLRREHEHGKIAK